MSLPVKAAVSCAAHVTASDKSEIIFVSAGAAYSIAGENAVAKLFFNWVRADTSIESARFVSSEYCARLSVPDFNPEATADSARNTVENIRDIINIRFMLIRAPPADFLVLSKDLFSFLVCFSDAFAPLW